MAKLSVATRRGLWRRMLQGFYGCLLAALAASVATGLNEASADGDSAVFPLIKQEQRRIRYRDPSTLRGIYVPATPPPPTVKTPLGEDSDRLIPLDEAIRLALADSEVVRQLAGTIAVSSGRTIYDPAVVNTTIDQQRGPFDPVINADNAWTQDEPATVDPTLKTESHQFSFDLSQRNLAGGTTRLGFSNNASRRSPAILTLEPQNRYATELSYTQPLLRGAGVSANRVPIVLSRIDTERSFFQLSDSVQELVRGTIEAYWAVVSSRTDVWAREIQVRQSEELTKRAKARFREGLADISEVAQAESALAQFSANLITARANLLSREAALQNILGIPPTSRSKLVPSTPPTSEQIEFDWNEVVGIAQVRRPDLIELKLILEADQQRLLLASNQARPDLDLFALYRWNGLEGRLPSGQRIGTRGDEFTDWQLGVNFSVPLFLRAERASLRSAQLVVARDRANLEQGVHNARHILALNFRNLDTFYLQYEAFRKAREAAKTNLLRQFAAYRTGNPVLFLNVLQAIGDWGNSVSQEAAALAQYNIELANLERQTGTILETHGVFFFEDRFCSLGPLWMSPRHDKPYPRDVRPSENASRYRVGDEAAENFFDLEDYPRRLPRPDEEDVRPIEVPRPPDESVPGAEPAISPLQFPNLVEPPR